MAYTPDQLAGMTQVSRSDAGRLVLTYRGATIYAWEHPQQIEFDLPGCPMARDRVKAMYGQMSEVRKIIDAWQGTGKLPPYYREQRGPGE